MVFWGMRKRGSRHQNKGAEVEFWGVEGREMGFIGLVIRPKSGKRRKETIHFCNFLDTQTASYSGIKQGKNTLKTSDLALYRTLIPNTLLLHPTPLEQQLPHYESRTMQWTKNLHLQFANAKNELLSCCGLRKRGNIIYIYLYNIIIIILYNRSAPPYTFTKNLHLHLQLQILSPLHSATLVVGKLLFKWSRM